MRSKLSAKTKVFLEKSELCRIATVSRDGSPHLVPVNYVFDDNHFYIFTDYGTKKLANLKTNIRVALLVDEYRPNKAVLAMGEAEILHRGQEYTHVYRKFYERFSWVRAGPWKEGEAPLLKIGIQHLVSWGL